MSTRLRVIGWKVQPVLMADDGENLTPLETNVQTIPAKDWPAFKDGGDEQALEALRSQVEELA